MLLAKSLGTINFFSEPEERELLQLKQRLGFPDPRNTDEYKDCDICANDIFRSSWREAGVQRQAFPEPTSARGEAQKTESETPPTPAADQERLIQMITTRVMQELARRSS